MLKWLLITLLISWLLYPIVRFFIRFYLTYQALKKQVSGQFAATQTPKNVWIKPPKNAKGTEGEQGEYVDFEEVK